MVEQLNIEAGHQGFVFPFESRAHQRAMRTPHRHKELELNIVIQGTAEYVLADRCYRLGPGSLVWLFPGQEHMLTKADERFKMYVVVFTCELVQKLLLLGEKYRLLAADDPIGSFCRKLDMPAVQKLSRICESLCELHTEEEIPSPAYHYAGQAFGFKQNAEYFHPDPEILNAGLSYLITYSWHMFRHQALREDQEVMSPTVEKCLQMLRNRVEQDYSLWELSRECGMSPNRLSRLFNEQTGMGLAEYKNRLKLELFIEHVQKHRYGLLEACYMAGFGSYSQFYKIFRQTYGISPKAYFKL
jgi:AraC-like DNA-binding protein